MHPRHVSRQYGAMTATATPPQATGLVRVTILAAMVALLALALVRPAVGANQSGPTVNEISWAMSGLCRALGGIDDVTPTRNVGGLLNVYFKCKGGYLDGLNCKIGDAGDPTNGSCSFRSAVVPNRWATIAVVTNGAVHDLASVNQLVQAQSPTQWATIAQIANGAAHDLTPANDPKAGAGDAASGKDRGSREAGKGRHGKTGHGSRR